MARNRIWVLVAVGGVASVAAPWLSVMSGGPGAGLSLWVWMFGAVVPCYVIGAAAVFAKPCHATARWMAAAGSWMAIATAVTVAARSLASVDALWLTMAVNLVQVFTMLATVAAFASALIAFPDGLYQHRWQQVAVRATWLLPTVTTLLWAVSRPSVVLGSIASSSSLAPSPIVLDSLTGLAPSSSLVVEARSVLWLVGAVALGHRWRGSTGQVRDQLRWPLLAVVVFAMLAGVAAFLAQLGLLEESVRRLPQFNGWVPGVALVSGSMLVALLKHRLIQVAVWLRRAILFGGLSGITAVVYLGVAGAVGLAAGHRASVGVAVLATLLAVGLFEPMRRWVQEITRRRIFGRQIEGEQLVRRVGDVLEDARDPARLGESLVAALVEGLGLRWATVVVRTGPRSDLHRTEVGGEVASRGGTPEVVVPLSHDGEVFGRLECGPKVTGEFSAADERLLATVAGQAALALANAELTAQLERRLEELNHQAQELAASRGRIVQAQLSERRRIERDLHDGIQQDIVASIAHIRRARNQLERDPQLASSTLRHLQDHTRTALDRLRELGRGIHPLALTHHGLVAAVEAEAARLPLNTTVQAAEDVIDARFDEQIEIAAYFVACEGLTNVIKHSGVEHAVVRLDLVADDLLIEVIDGGRGCSVPADGSGSGLVGLSDRVESLGGGLVFASARGAGTRLSATLPATRIGGER